MGGVDAVRYQIQSDFGGVEVHETIDHNSFSTVLGFSAEGRTFVVRVSNEYNDDYGTGTTASISDLGSKLRASKDGKVAVKTTGVA